MVMIIIRTMKIGDNSKKRTCRKKTNGSDNKNINKSEKNKANSNNKLNKDLNNKNNGSSNKNKRNISNSNLLDEQRGKERNFDFNKKLVR